MAIPGIASPTWAEQDYIRQNALELRWLACLPRFNTKEIREKMETYPRA